ncbi:MAG: hypothetical protein NW226_10080 [Microscillaceae bacterium]|nr:hypothetical protein [Microscillaceae bacterium]
MNNHISSLQQIQELQTQQKTRFYNLGMFPSQRFHAFLPYVREDDNIYFSALIAFGLMRLESFFSEEEKQLAQTIRQKVIQNYPLYESVNKAHLYNFYRTNPPGQYPNGYVFSKLGRFQLPTDADDTVMIHLTQESSPEIALQVKAHLEKHANRTKVQNTLKIYQNLGAYSVWFGSPKMPIEFDFCVLCNILYFVKHYELPWTTQDEDSLTYICSVLQQKQHISQPFRVSYIYPRAAIMLYHVTRLMQSFEIGRLEELKQGIRQDILCIYHHKSTTLPEKILLAISGMRLGFYLEIPGLDWQSKDAKNLAFFYAPMLAGTSSGILDALASYRLFQILYRSEAFYTFLEMEYHLLHNFFCN